MKFLTPSENAVVKKDYNEAWSSMTVRVFSTVLPAFTAVVLPIIFFIIIYNISDTDTAAFRQITKLLPESAAAFGVKQKIFYCTVNFIFPIFFLLVPIMVASAVSACCFAGENERGTLETLFLTPLKPKRIFKAKFLGCISFAAIVTALSFAAFSITVSIGDILLSMPFFIDWNWLIIFFILTPAVLLFCTALTAAAMCRGKGCFRSMQMSGYIATPLILLFLLQFTGLFVAGARTLLIASLAVALADAALVVAAEKSFVPQKLLFKPVK
jgi:ABC-type Na+ efflux pump permease subunit